jgi:hypothetical protein
MIHKIAIRPQTSSEGKEVIKLLKKMGGRNTMNLLGRPVGYYYIEAKGAIVVSTKSPHGYKVRTLATAKALIKTSMAKVPVPSLTYPRVMLVSHTGYDKQGHWFKRVVLMKKKDQFLAWDYAETLEKAEEQLSATVWQYAKELDIV